MWYELLSIIFAGISAIASIVTSIAAFSAYSIYKKKSISQNQKSGDKSIQSQIGEINEYK